MSGELWIDRLIDHFSKCKR